MCSVIARFERVANTAHRVGDFDESRTSSLSARGAGRHRESTLDSGASLRIAVELGPLNRLGDVRSVSQCLNVLCYFFG